MSIAGVVQVIVLVPMITVGLVENIYSTLQALIKQPYNLSKRKGQAGSCIVEGIPKCIQDSWKLLACRLQLGLKIFHRKCYL